MQEPIYWPIAIRGVKLEACLGLANILLKARTILNRQIYSEKII